MRDGNPLDLAGFAAFFAGRGIFCEFFVKRGLTRALLGDII
jgi:hypothetical protein